MSFWEKLFGRKDKPKTNPQAAPPAPSPTGVKPAVPVATAPQQGDSRPAAPVTLPSVGIQSFTSEQLGRNAAEFGEMYFDCPHCGHCERLNDVGKAIYKTNPFQFKEYQCLKCRKKFDAAPRMKFGDCPTSASATPNTLAAQVKFKKKWSKVEGGVKSTYEEFTGPNEEAAKAYLNTRDITESLYYLVVETPVGCWGKDLAGIYKED